MTKVSHKEILERAISKAIEGGWTPTTTTVIETNEGSRLAITWQGRRGEPFDVETIIFNREFAKALWGNSNAYFTIGVGGDTISGNYVNYVGHLANMVVADDPIKYLGDNI